MTDLPLDASDGQILYAADYNKILGTRTGDLKPIDDTTRNYTDGGGDVGTASVTWENVQTNTLTVEEESTFSGMSSFNGGVDIRHTSKSTSQTWTVPTGITQIRYLAVAPGGGGGGEGGGGGGAGQAIPSVTLETTPGDLIVITIGSGGTAGSSSGTDGGDGGNTVIEWQSSVGATYSKCILLGGKGGVGQNTVGSGATAGGDGGGVYSENGVAGVANGDGGRGGHSLYGFGGTGGIEGGASPTAAGYGGGGGGGADTQAGTVGGEGLVRIHY